MAETMIERVARALRDEIASPTSDGEWVLEEGFRSAEHFTDLARTIVASMREPIALMMENAAYAMPGVLGEHIDANQSEAWRLWRKMIDAALSEEGV